MPVYSIESPLGAAITGARADERRTYHLPNGTPLAVTLLKAVPYGMHTPKPQRAQSVPPRRNSSRPRSTAKRTTTGRRSPAAT